MYDVSVQGELLVKRIVHACFSETTTKGQGFQGCLFRAQWDNLYPLARVFQDPRGPNIVLDPPST